MRRAFTVVELLVAVVVLLAVIIATSKIFNTASKVASTGEATADVLQQAGVLEEQLRRDLNAICRDGYFAIQCVVVRNDVNQVLSPGANAPLLNPQLDENATIRCDQLVFFTSGSEVSARWAGPGDLASSGGGQQARVARVYYGHGVQFPTLMNNPIPADVTAPDAWPIEVRRPVITGVTPAPSGNARLVPVTPWTWFNPSTFRLGWRYSITTQADGPRVPVNQPECRQWVLARRAVLLADDGGRAIYYPEPANVTLAERLGPSSAPSIFGDRSYTIPDSDALWMYRELRDRNRVPLSGNLIPSPTLQSGWTDIAASDLDKVRRILAPTLRLSQAVAFGTDPYLQSISVPWSVPQNGVAPLSWPVGAAWPGDTPTIVVGGNADVGPVNAFSHQRDRIMRGTFGMSAFGQLPANAPLGLLGWPRTEKSIANTDRRSEMLAASTLLTNCSSFQVDWTWEPLTGRREDSAGRPLIVNQNLRIGAPPSFPVTPGPSAVLRGFEPSAASSPVWQRYMDDPPSTSRPQPWFGYPDAFVDPSFPGGLQVPQSQRLGVNLAQSPVSMPLVARADAPAVPVTNVHMRTVAQSVEGYEGANPITQPAAVTAPFGAGVPVRVYTSVFGFNQDEAFTVTPDGYRVIRDDFTPWPTQIRVTCTLHDPRAVLERGREFQFVLDVPKRRKD